MTQKRIALNDHFDYSYEVPGSLRAKQPTFSPVVNGVIHCRFCSSVPNFKMGPM